MPCSFPPTSVVTTVTPVAKWPMILRKPAASIFGSFLPERLGTPATGDRAWSRRSRWSITTAPNASPGGVDGDPREHSRDHGEHPAGPAGSLLLGSSRSRGEDRVLQPRLERQGPHRPRADRG